MILADTRLSSVSENDVRNEWGGLGYFSSLNSQARGVAILIKKHFPVTVLDTFNDVNGNIVAVLLEFESKRILIQGIYGPNNDDPDFYSDLCFNIAQLWDVNYSVFVGDWNIALNPEIDTRNYRNYNNPRARSELKNKIQELNLIDIFRELNPSERRFTWKKWGEEKYSRLDYFLVSSSLLPFVQKTEILASCFSDHSPILLDIDFAKFTRGRGFWKMNNSLLFEKDYVELIKNTIK